MPWARIAGVFGWLGRFLFPERSAYQEIISRYQQALTDRQKDHEADIARYQRAMVDQQAEFDRREAELRDDIASLRRETTQGRREKAQCQERLAQVQQQVWELSAVLDHLDAVRKIREDPDFQYRTAEQIRRLMRPEPPPEGTP
jgi:septal ring factor EnvC (AmiA/AmiB activator)